MADRKEELQTLMQGFVNDKKCIDIAAFHKKYKKEYSLLPHYFGSVNEAIEQMGWIKISKAQHVKGKGATLKNQLAYDYLQYLRKNNTLEDIANKYGVTRAAIGQLHKALKSTIESSNGEFIENEKL